MKAYRPDFITHYYLKGTQPFRSLSALDENEAIEIMRSLFDETVFGARFRDPGEYLRNRRRSERWVRDEFILKGGKPALDYPIYFVLGKSNWLKSRSPYRTLHSEIQIKLSDLAPNDISFTYPDSMISFWLGNEKPDDLFLPALHGQVFTRSEILAIVEQKGDPEKSWNTNLPATLAPYIEAQVWNPEPLKKFLG